MPVGTGGGLELDRTARALFADLVVADDELLRAEFDALIRATWRTRRPPSRKASWNAGAGRCSRAHLAAVEPTVARREPGRRARATERSPPGPDRARSGGGRKRPAPARPPTR